MTENEIILTAELVTEAELDAEWVELFGEPEAILEAELVEDDTFDVMFMDSEDDVILVAELVD